MSDTWGRVRSLARQVGERAREAMPQDPEAQDEPVFPALQWMTAALFVAAGAEAVIRGRSGSPGRTDPLAYAPLVAAPLAGAIHTARALTSAPEARLVAQIVDGLAAGVAVAAIGRVAYDAFGRSRGASDPGAWPAARSAHRLAAAVAPLTFGATAALGLLLEHEEDRERRERERLRRRASVVERLVPRRRGRVDHIVVHV